MNIQINLLIGTGMLLVAPFSASAQDVVGKPEQSVGANEIVVTATRRAQRLMDVPQSITAISADDLARLNATQLRDYANTIPALTISSNGGAGQNQITLRGVTSGADVASTVGVYVDDIPYGGSTVFAINTSLALDAGLFDLDRIEVLRGPQGTLYGASSMGGVLKYVTRKPNLDEGEGTMQVGLSSTDHGGLGYNAAAAVSAPLSADKIAVRASGYYSRDAGYVDNVVLEEKDVGRARIYGGRLDLLLTPTEELSIRLSGFAQNIHRDGTAQVDNMLAGAAVNGELQQSRVLREPFDQRFRVVSGTIDYDFGSARLTSITSYQTNTVAFRLDASALYVPLLASVGLPIASAATDGGIATKKLAQEVRLASSGETSIDWIIGGFYTHESSIAPTSLAAYNADGSPFPINLLTAKLPSTYKELAGFGNVTVHFSEKFDVTGGLRYAHNRQTFTQNTTGILAPSVPTLRSHEGVVTYLANARYRFSSHAAAYARVATGYRPGGPNVVTSDPLTGAPLGPPTFDSDTLASYEFGFRGETVDRSFSVDAAAYHIDWNDMLISGVRNGLNTYINTGGAKIDGAELTLIARPSRSLMVTGAFAYQHARLAADSVDLGGRKGDPLPNVPKFTAAISADYRGDGPGLKPTFGGTLRFVSDRYAGFDGNPNLPQYRVGDYATVDLRAGVMFGQIDAQLFVRNLFDDRGAISASTAMAALGGPARVAVLQPRIIGFNLSTRF
ncbi:TonB-dependent receptor [Novosphingobium sp. P6W]|uniref:TonB-dependent receptor n=1 Tax=Novosphingobium sp. P6W TaxID=1609758 RepID=UPI0006969D7E|nr:TonB-dependent receptor [Novosphingobium sp. P6W]AXB78842.1 TonB-dependent receptor [Novosphingobium sp. P6W]